MADVRIPKASPHKMRKPMMGFFTKNLLAKEQEY